MQVQVLQGGDLGQHAHCAIAHVAAPGERQPLQPREGSQQEQPRVADLRKAHSLLRHPGRTSELCGWHRLQQVLQAETE